MTDTQSGLGGGLSRASLPSARFEACLPYILQSEGGNDDNPHDPGGRTSRGITQREYNAYRQAKGEPVGDVWNASSDEVDDIYYQQYWLPWCPQMPVGVDLCFFDMCVNSGPYRAIVLLQRALGVNDDGHIGVITSAAIKNANPIKLVSAYSDQRRTFYKSLTIFKYFGKGWLNRVQYVENAALKMAAEGGSV